MNRRRFVGFLAAGATALVFRFKLGRALASANRLGLQPGTQLAGGRWTVVEIHPSSGGFAVVMESAGEQFQVDVLARSTTTPGVANTRELSLYLVNQGAG